MADKPSVDELRGRLRELGYLDAGVDRFVLGSVRGSRSLLSMAGRSSARIGVLAALLFGPSAALALGARLPALVTGLRDALVLALYLGVLFGVAVMVVTLAAVLLLGALASRSGGERAGLARRARHFSRAAGLIVAGGCLVYLVFWWGTVNPIGQASWRSAWTWPVLAVAVFLSLLLGRAVRLTTVAVAARGLEAVPGTLGRPSLSRRWTAGLAALAFALAAGLLFLVTPYARDAAVPPPSAFAAMPTGGRLTVIAVDGFDVEYVTRLQQAGRLPVLRRLMAGARVALPASDAPDPARTWTSLATGQPAAVHGVSGIETRRVSGIEGTVGASPGRLGGMIAAATDLLRLTRPALTTSEQRRSKTFWEVAAEHGVSTLVVNWWATWPVPQGAGVVLSDRAMLRLEVGGEQDAEIAPAGLYPALRAAWPALREEARQRVLGALGQERDDEAFAALRRAAEQDALALGLARLATKDAPALRAIYLPGLDIAQHELLGRAAGLPASALAVRVEALGRYYDLLDMLVAPLADEGPAQLVVLVTDPGRSASGGGGLLALAGSAVRPGNRIEAARNDVMPTLLYALGLPLSRELPGRARLELFTDAFVAGVPRRVVATYGPRVVPPRPANATPLDREMLERLRSLGYVR